MPYKSILVHVDAFDACASRMELAIAVAVAHGAHLIGLHIRPSPAALAETMAGEIGDLWLNEFAKQTDQAAGKARSSFEAAVKAAGVSAEWRDTTGPTIDTMALHARYADLCVVSQSGDNNQGLETEGRLDHTLVLAAGTPVLVVPNVGRFPACGGRVLVAWDASREARRAVSDALPILERAKRVTVLTILPAGGKSGHGDIPTADICLHLARHGVNTEGSQIQADDIDVGNMLLSRACDIEADLLVMGAYGHSRLREVILGGVTRFMLNHLTLPILLSH